MTWTVHKFGGTSVADASCIRRVAGIIGGQPPGNNLAVVVSAMKGVTDDLLGLVDMRHDNPAGPAIQQPRGEGGIMARHPDQGKAPGIERRHLENFQGLPKLRSKDQRLGLPLP